MAKKKVRLVFPVLLFTYAAGLLTGAVWQQYNVFNVAPYTLVAMSTILTLVVVFFMWKAVKSAMIATKKEAWED